MTQQPFSRPGAIDLSGLQRPAPPAGGPAVGHAGAPAGGTPHRASPAAGRRTPSTSRRRTSSRCWRPSITAPVALVFYSPSQAPESATMAADVATVANEYDGRFLAGLIDIDASPAIAQAMQIAQVPILFVLLDGRPAAQPIPGVLSLEELRVLFNQLAKQLTAQGIAGRHQPRTSGAPVDAGDDDGEPRVDPRYAAARTRSARATSTAVAEYQKLVDGNPADAEAAAGLAMAKVLQRTQGVDLQAARAAAAASPTTSTRRRWWPISTRSAATWRTRSTAWSMSSAEPPATTATARGASAGPLRGRRQRRRRVLAAAGTRVALF